MSHTPGPWEVTDYAGKWGVWDRHSNYLAHVDDEANARFIATAPDMYNKLVEVRAHLVDQFGESEGTEEIDAILAKANWK